MARKVTTEIRSEHFWLMGYSDGSLSLMPPPRDIVKLSGMQCCGEISHSAKVAVLDEWRRKAVEILLKCGILEVRHENSTHPTTD